MGAAQTSNPPSFETVWAALQEVAANQKETDRILKESREETDRIFKKNAQKTQEYNDDFYRKIGALTNLFGDFTLGMVAPKLCEKFMDFGHIFPRANLNVYVNDKVNEIYLEIDIILENGSKAMLVEVKTKLTIERINKHVERLEKIRRYADIHGDRRSFLGAVAGFAVTEEVRKKAMEEGLYLIEPDGENFNITPPPGKPKEW